MKKLFLFTGLIFLLAAFSNAQTVAKRNAKITPVMVQSPNLNTTSTTTVDKNSVTTQKRKCGTMEHMQWMFEQDPTLKAKMEQEDQKFNEYVETHQAELENSKATYTLPVVVHVVYNGTSGYVTAARVAEQITQTNKDWGGINGRSMESFSPSLRADCGITLCLATKDPSGNATTGIDYKQTTVTSFTTNDNVKKVANGGAAAWDPTKYLNIWVCNMPDYCGYAQFPTFGINSTFGVVIHYQFFGLTGASSPYNGGGTTSHEFGHCFNLWHTWGDDGSACTGSDQCADTPNQASETYGNHSGVLTDACTTTAPGIMYMNFMDYSDDADYANMTPNQATRMQSAISTYLMSVANNAATACNTTPAAPVAAFTASATTVAVNTTVTFTDQSTNSPTSWSWALTPSTGFTYQNSTSATSQNPQIKFTTAGIYTVALTVTNAQGSNTCTKTSYITVNPAGTQTCGRLNYPLTGTPVLYTNTTGGYLAGNNSYGDKAKAEYFANYSPYTQIDSALFTFGIAKDGGTTTNITFNVWNNAGTAGAPGAIIGTATVPLSTIMSNVSSSAMTIVKFTPAITITGPFYIGVMLPTVTGDTLALITNTDGETSPGTGWEMFSDNTWYAYSSTSSWGVNIANAIFASVCTTSTDINDVINGKEVSIYPNPANNEFTVDFSGFARKDVTVEVYNMIGKLVKSSSSNGQIEKMVIDISNESTGVYMVNIKTPQGTIIKKLSLIK